MDGHSCAPGPLAKGYAMKQIAAERARMEEHDIARQFTKIYNTGATDWPEWAVPKDAYCHSIQVEVVSHLGSYLMYCTHVQAL